MTNGTRWIQSSLGSPREPGSITGPGTPGGVPWLSPISPTGTREAEMGLRGRRQVYLKSISCSIVLFYLSFFLPGADKPRGTANSTLALDFRNKASQFWYRASPIYILPLHHPSQLNPGFPPSDCHPAVSPSPRICVFHA